MKTTECFELIRKSTMSASQIAKVTGLSWATVNQYAEYLGVKLRTRRHEKRTVCVNKPHCCFACPYEDCIDSSSCAPDETEFVNSALNTGRRDGRS